MGPDMEGEPNKSVGSVKSQRRWGVRRSFQCHTCRETKPFCWSCPCGFEICDDCLRENMWGMSNNVIWICPDCGRIRGL